MHIKFLALGGLATSVAASAVPALGYERKLLLEALAKRQTSTSGCSGDDAPSTEAPKANVWAPISPQDNFDVWTLLHDPATGLNLTDASDAVATDNYLFWIDTLPVNKTDVLPYLDGDGPLPPKYARAIIFEGGKEVPDSQEYYIGPLPVSNETTVEKLDYIYNGGSGGSVPYDARYVDAKKNALTTPLIASAMGNISDITEALFDGAAFFGPGNNRTTLTTTAGTPVSFDGTQGFRNIMFRYPGSGSYLTPIDFFLLIDCSGTDPSHYSVKGYVTNSEFYPDEASLREAFEAGTLAQEYNQTRDQSWTQVDYKPELGTRELEDRFAPTSLELGGKRYQIDPEAQYIEYLGFSFYVSFSRTLGIMFYDIKYKGDRIIYELSMQEALAQYAGKLKPIIRVGNPNPNPNPNTHSFFFLQEISPRLQIPYITIHTIVWEQILLPLSKDSTVRSALPSGISHSMKAMQPISTKTPSASSNLILVSRFPDIAMAAAPEITRLAHLEWLKEQL